MDEKENIKAALEELVKVEEFYHATETNPKRYDETTGRIVSAVRHIAAEVDEQGRDN